jgi:cytoskeletal protein RodZ
VPNQLCAVQRSCSNARAEPHTSQELGGAGRLLLPSTSIHQARVPHVQPAQPSRQSGLPTSTTSQDTSAVQWQASLISRSSSLARKELGAQGMAASGMSNGVTAAAAAGVWNSDDNGLTGYATG